MIYSSLFLIGAISLPAYASGKELIEVENPVKDKFIVTTKANGNKVIGASQADRIRQIIAGPDGDDIGAQSHGEVEHIYGSTIEGFAATLDEVGLQNVLNSPDVESVEQDGYVNITQVGSWGLDRIDDEDLPLDQSYNPTFGNAGAGVTAYIIDTGILFQHDEFEGRATQEFNSAGGQNEDCHGHGTHVAGTVGAKTYGVANKVKLVGVKVLSCSGSGTNSGVIAGIDWVAANAKKPATANMSLGGGKSAASNAAVKRLVDSGVPTVVAAGNNNGDACDKSPASELSAITVGSTTNVDARSSFSNWGTCVDIFAPGSSIKAPWIGSKTATRTISGTSMASPHVCGATALYLAEDPNLSPDAVNSKMLADSISGTITNVGSGSPNKFLFVGPDRGPTAPTTSIPTLSPVTAAPMSPVTARPTPASSLSDYDFHPFLDSHGGDIGNLRGGVERYAKVCSSLAACLGFNSNGWYKSVLKPKDQWNKWTTNPKLGFYTKKEKEPNCRDGRKPLEINVVTSGSGKETKVSMKRRLNDGDKWAKRLSIFKNGFESNKLTTLKHCLSDAHCYKLAVKDKGGNGMEGGKYNIKIDGKTFAESKFPSGAKEYHLINCK